MDWREVAKRTEGLQTLESFSAALGIGKGTAVLYLHRMRGAGFVTTMRGAMGKRVYDISPLSLRRVGSPGLFDLLNGGSPLKLTKPFEHRVYGRSMPPEEAVVRALKTGDERMMLASLGLFRKVRDFRLLYRLAKEEGLARRAGAFYSLSRRCFRVARIDGRILRMMKASEAGKEHDGGRAGGGDFKDIEKEWGVRIPFNRADLEKLGAAS